MYRIPYIFSICEEERARTPDYNAYRVSHCNKMNKYVSKNMNFHQFFGLSMIFQHQICGLSIFAFSNFYPTTLSFSFSFIKLNIHSINNNH